MWAGCFPFSMLHFVGIESDEKLTVPRRLKISLYMNVASNELQRRKEKSIFRIANEMRTRAASEYHYLSCTLHPPCVEIHFYALLWRIDGRIVRSKAVRNSYRSHSHDECGRQRKKWDVQRNTFKILEVIIYSMSSLTKNEAMRRRWLPSEIAQGCSLYWRLFIFDRISFRRASNYVSNPPHLVKCAICNSALKEFYSCTAISGGVAIYFIRSHIIQFPGMTFVRFLLGNNQKKMTSISYRPGPSSINSTGLDWWIAWMGCVEFGLKVGHWYVSWCLRWDPFCGHFPGIQFHYFHFALVSANRKLFIFHLFSWFSSYTITIMFGLHDDATSIKWTNIFCETQRSMMCWKIATLTFRSVGWIGSTYSQNCDFLPFFSADRSLSLSLSPSCAVG